MNNEVKCPYCGTIQDEEETVIAADESEDNHYATIDCEKCEKEFGFNFNWTLYIDEVIKLKSDVI